MAVPICPRAFKPPVSWKMRPLRKFLACAIKMLVGRHREHRVMTETEAKNILLAKLEKMAHEDCPLAWVGDVLYEAPTAFIIEGSLYAEGENPVEDAGFCAVDKNTGKSGMVLPYPGRPLSIERFRDFRWDDWIIV